MGKRHIAVRKKRRETGLLLRVITGCFAGDREGEAVFVKHALVEGKKRLKEA